LRYARAGWVPIRLARRVDNDLASLGATGERGQVRAYNVLERTVLVYPLINVKTRQTTPKRPPPKVAVGSAPGAWARTVEAERTSSATIAPRATHRQRGILNRTNNFTLVAAMSMSMFIRAIAYGVDKFVAR
jgi:hypothetical protein